MMKRILLASATALNIAALVFQPAQATVLTFDDLAGDESSVPDGYGGFNWNNQSTVGSFNAVHYSYQNTGYGYGTVSGGNVIFNWGGQSPVGITLAKAGTFTYTGAFFTAAWDNETVSFAGLLDGVVVDTSRSYTITTSAPQFIELDWTGINGLTISNTGRCSARVSSVWACAGAATPSEPLSLAGSNTVGSRCDPTGLYLKN
jgi:hypothetical protein